MAIGSLYSANNVVVGQAAVFVAPNNTPLIDLTKFNTADPFDPTAWTSYTLATGTATSQTLTLTFRGVAYTTGTLTTSGLTAAAIASALNALAPVAAAGTAVVTGTSPNFSISLPEGVQSGVLTTTPTGGTNTLTGPVWSAVGATEQGWQLGAEKSTQTINIEEQSTPVGTTISSQNLTIQGNLSEDISRTLALTMNATVASTAPTVTTGGYETISLTDTPLLYAVGMVTTNAEGYGRIVYAPSWTSLGNVSVAFRRAAGQRLYAASFSTVCNTNQIKILNFVAPHS